MYAFSSPTSKKVTQKLSVNHIGSSNEPPTSMFSVQVYCNSCTCIYFRWNTGIKIIPIFYKNITSIPKKCTNLIDRTTEKLECFVLCGGYVWSWGFSCVKVLLGCGNEGGEVFCGAQGECPVKSKNEGSVVSKEWVLFCCQEGFCQCGSLVMQKGLGCSKMTLDGAK